MFILSLACLSALGLSAPVFAASASAQTSWPHLTEADKNIWRSTLKRTVMRPPCCGSCGLFTMADAGELWKFLTEEKTTERGEQLWRRHAKRLLTEFAQESPQRYAQLYKDLPSEKRP